MIADNVNGVPMPCRKAAAITQHAFACPKPCAYLYPVSCIRTHLTPLRHLATWLANEETACNGLMHTFELPYYHIVSDLDVCVCL